MNDLHDHLDDLARAQDVPAGDLDAVLARGRRRTRTARATAGVLTALAVGVTGVVVAADGDDAETPIAAGGESAPTTGESGITWTSVEPSSALAYLRPMSTSVSGSLYALSTAPGQAPTDLQPLRVWTSSDGVDWRDVGVPEGDIYLSDLDATDGRLYAIGTGQATAATTDIGRIPEVRVGWSDDDGSTWQTGALDIDLDAIASRSLGLSWSQRAVARSGDTVVAAVGLTAQLDVRAVLPEGDDAPNGWAITGTGVDVLGPAPEDDPCPTGQSPDRPMPADKAPNEDDFTPDRVWPYGCQDGDRFYSIQPQEVHGVERTYTWEDLGVGGDLLRAVLGHPFVFAADAADGVFERVDAAIPSEESYFSTLTGDVSGFDLIVFRSSDSAGVRLHSTDGRTWAPAAPLPGGLQWITAAGSLGDRTVLFGGTADNEAIVTLDGTAVRARDVIGDAADCDEAYLTAGDADAAGIAMVVGCARGETATFVLLTSRDGSTWDVDRLEQLAGEPVTNVNGVIVTADRMLVNATTGERDQDGHLRQLVLVGTI